MNDNLDANKRFVWKVRYTLELNEEGDRVEYGGYEATMLCSDDVIDVVRDLKEQWVGKSIDGDIDGEEFSSSVIGIKVTEAKVVAALTKFEDE